MIYFILVLLAYAKAYENDLLSEQSSIERDLISCSSYTTCEACNDNHFCNYQNGGWSYYDTWALRNAEYDQVSEAQYCNKAIENDFLYISDEGHSLDMFAFKNSSYTEHPICEWGVALRTDLTVTIDISAGEDHKEDFFMYTNSNEESQYKYSKYFAHCGSTSTQIKLKNTGYIRLRVKRLSQDSNYFIKVSQDHKDDWLVFIVIVTFTSLAWVLLCISIAIYMICKHTIQGRQNVRVTFSEKRDKKKLIQKCLDNMNTGVYSKFSGNLKYDQNTWVIWLEDFEADSRIKMTNECLHVFHEDCISSWFKNINCRKELVCAFWKTPITDKSKPKDIEGLNGEDTETQLANWVGNNNIANRLPVNRLVTIQNETPRNDVEQGIPIEN